MRFTRWVLLFLLSVCGFCVPGVSAFQIRFLGHYKLPIGASVFETTVGGLSSLDYLPSEDLFVVLSDDRAQYGPARFYSMRIDYDAGGVQGVRAVKVTSMLQPDGKPFPEYGLDPEGMRYNPKDGLLYLSTEGEATNGKKIDPFVRSMTLNGTFVREYSIPEYYRSTGDGPTGVRDNEGFESLAFSSDYRLLYVATETALKQDGPDPTTKQGSPSRILAFDLSSGKVVGEYVYVVEPVARASDRPGVRMNSGLSDLLATEPGRFLSLERSYTEGLGTTIRLFEVSLAGATNVSGRAKLDSGPFRPVQKKFVADIGAKAGIDPDNLEGICFGRKLANGHDTLVLVSDNNFNPLQVTQFLVFEVIPDSASSPTPDPGRSGK